MDDISSQTESLHLRWEKDTRYYQVILQKDLLGCWCLTRVWGQRNSRLGQIKHLPLSSYQEGVGKITEIEKVRNQRDYLRVI